MLAFLSLIRLPNLLIIAFTQYMIRICLIEPILHLAGFRLQMNDFSFFLLVLSTVFIAAGGFVINDYFDIHIDAINKPKHLVIDKKIKRRVAISAHAVLSFLGVAIGIFLSYKSNILLSGGAIFSLTVIGLWFYSTSFKYQLLIGNIIISLFTAIIPLLVVLYEFPLMIRKYNNQLFREMSEMGTTTKDTILLWVGAFALAAFVLSMIREIIKDIEDYEGDKEYGCRTAPVVFGIKKVKVFVSLLIVFAITGIGYVQFKQYTSQDKISFFYFLAGISLPLLFLLFRTLTAKEKKHFHFASVLTKIIMLTGLCYLFLFRYLVMQ
ncbi:MAG: geranylgeranylglycerol-phosphate geranylgeranyltransferase [Bacteroidota bacterium]